jgi:RNA polymerase sigma-70 factor (ECF subfamily)
MIRGKSEHAMADLARRRSRDPIVGSVPEPEKTEASHPVEDVELQSELGECVALFVARLPSPYREAVTLTELEGITQKDAAEMLGISVTAMKSRVQRGRQKIRDMFEACCRISVDARGRGVECEANALDQVPSDCRCAAEGRDRARSRWDDEQIRMSA